MASGSEADATAIRGVVTAALTAGATRPHIITRATEHSSVLAACEYAERFHGAEVTILPGDRDGLLTPDVLASAMRPTTVLVSVMHASHETGVIQPIRELVAVAHAHGALFHTDAAQTVGKIVVEVADVGVDPLTLVGHKMYAPKGVAALVIRTGSAIAPLVSVGDRLAVLRDELGHRLVADLSGRVHLNGDRAHHLPQTLYVSIDGAAGHAILAACTGASGLIILWQFTHRLPETRERRALRLMAWSFFALAAYVTVESIRALVGDTTPNPAPVGIGLAVTSLLVMPFLSWAQRRTGRALNSNAVVADSTQTLLCTYLSAVLLVGLVLNAILGWDWADPIAGLVIAAVAVREGREAWRGESCSCTPGQLAPGDTDDGGCADGCTDD